VVGTILNLINQGDAIFGTTSINWIKIVLTYFAPRAVDTRAFVTVDHFDRSVVENQVEVLTEGADANRL